MDGHAERLADNQRCGCAHHADAHETPDFLGADLAHPRQIQVLTCDERDGDDDEPQRDPQPGPEGLFARCFGGMEQHEGSRPRGDRADDVDRDQECSEVTGH